MATTLGGGKVKLDNGQVVTAQRGNWYDGQQFWDDTLSARGVINSLSDQQGAGQKVSQEVNNQSAAAQGKSQQEFNNYLNPSQTSNGGGGGVPAPVNLGGGSGVGIVPPQPTIDLPALYANLYKSSGISDIEKKLSDETNAYNDAQSKINDNPFLSEARRVGKVAKLTNDFQNSTASLKNDIAVKKADVETQLNLQTKQFDINSQQAKQAFDQFTSLLNAGALDNANGEDIANLVRSTGLSSSMILSAVKASKDKNTPTSVAQFDDGVNQGFAVFNPQTGEIIKKQIISASKPNAGGSTGVVNESKQFDLDKKQAPALVAQAAKAGKTLKDMLSFYSQWLEPQQIYTIYNTNSPYGAAKEDKKTLASLGIKK